MRSELGIFAISGWLLVAACGQPQAIADDHPSLARAAIPAFPSAEGGGAWTAGGDRTTSEPP